MEVWKIVFPSIANEVDGGSREAIIHVVSAYSTVHSLVLLILGG